MIFSSNQFLFTADHIDLKTLHTTYPFIAYDKEVNKSKKSHKHLYFKHNNKEITIGDCFYHFIPGIDIIVCCNYIPRDFIYYNSNGELLSFNDLATNSLGNKVIYDSIAKRYRLVDNYGQQLSDTLFEKVNPFLWQSRILAAQTGNKWGLINETGDIFLPFEYDAIGPLVNNIVAVKKNDIYSFFYFYEPGKYRTISTSKIHTENYDNWLQTYYIDNINGNNILFWEIGYSEYGFYNLDTSSGCEKLDEIPHFNKGVACTYNTDYYGLLLSATDGIIATSAQRHNNFEPIGENLYAINEDDDDTGETITKIYSNKGTLLYNSRLSGIRLNGTFSQGVAPIFVGGGLQSDKQKYFYGYMYNTFSTDQENNYGSMGQDNLITELNNKLKTRVELLDYYQILGNKALNKGEYSKAINYFNTVLTLYPYYQPALYGKGISYLTMGDYQQALESLKHIIGLNGSAYATALCYYNLGDFENAASRIRWVKKDDPTYSESLELKEYIETRLAQERIKKEEKWNKALMILGAISNGLQIISQTLNATQPSQQTYVPIYNPTTSSSTQQVCPTCNGTGLNPTKERAAFYNYNEETYSNSPCEVCGDSDSHYHKPCLNCLGKGYINKF